MTTRIKPLTQRPAWKALAAHHKKVQNLQLRKLFADDSKRGERMTAAAAGLFLDYSKNRVTDETIKLLVRLANESDLSGRIEAMFSGEKINLTENRAVLHVALRAPKERDHHGGRKKRRAGGPRSARKDDRLFRACPERRVERSYRQANQKRRSISGSAAPISAR